jgi:hypothetical protein
MFRNVPPIPDHSAAVQVPGPPAGSDRASNSESGSDSESVTEIVTEFKLTSTVTVGLSRSHRTAALAIFSALECIAAGWLRAAGPARGLLWRLTRSTVTVTSHSGHASLSLGLG